MGVGPGPLQLSSSPDLGYLDVRIEETDYSSFAVVYIYKELEGARSTMVQLYSEAGPAHKAPPRPPSMPRPRPPRSPRPSFASWPRLFRADPKSSFASSWSLTPKSGPARVGPGVRWGSGTHRALMGRGCLEGPLRADTQAPLWPSEGGDPPSWLPETLNQG